VQRAILALGALLALALVGPAPVSPVHAQTAVLKLPFAAGTSWRIIQGYEGGTHGTGPERYALDLVREGGPTAGTEVLAPASGTVWWMNPPGTGNGCLLIKIDGGNGLIVEMCHIIARPLRVDQRVEVGQPVGTVAPDGAVGNNGLAHLHLSLHRTPDFGVTRIPAPFAPPDGLPLDGVSLPPNGTPNQYACPGPTCRGSLTSTNAVGMQSAPVSMPPAPSTVTGPPPLAPVVVPLTLRSGVVARVAAGPNPGDCVNVRGGPGLNTPVLTCLPDGVLVTLVDGPIAADGRLWWRLEGLGWAAADYLIGVSAPVPVLQPGGRAIVDAGAGDCLNLRAAPGLAAPVLACLPSGARVTITDGPRSADGRTWWQVDGRGWAAADYLQPRDES
jgi:uncharacterized protein YraI